jgi:hypothetical protein
MSAMPPMTDVERTFPNVRQVPKAIRRYRFAVKAFQAASESI